MDEYMEIAERGLTTHWDHVNQVLIRAGYSEGDAPSGYRAIVRQSLDLLVEAGRAELDTDERGNRYYRRLGA